MCVLKIEQMFWPNERITYCGRVFKPAKAAKGWRFFAASGTPTNRRGGNEAGWQSQLVDGGW
jgi:hypothetical protein